MSVVQNDHAAEHDAATVTPATDFAYEPDQATTTEPEPDAPAAEAEVTGDATEQATPATAEDGLPTIAHVDPRTLIVEANVRSDAALTPAFIGSIKTHGVLVPVLVHRTAEGLRVRAGQRRTLASIEADQPLIPAYVVDGDDDKARRIVEQMVENDQRAALADHDRVTGFQQLSLLGLSAATIAKRTGTKKAIVSTALTVAASEVASAVAAKYDLTLDQAAVLADFQDDEDAVKALTVCAVKTPEQFDHLAQQYRDQRTERQIIAALTDDLTAQGITVIDRPGYEDQPRSLTNLATVDTEGTKSDLTPENHAECPGRVAWISVRNYNGPAVVHGCADPTANGHVGRYSQGTLSGGGTKGKMTDAQKAERRTIVANNKAWKSAETVRRTWLATFAQRKTAPKDAPQFIAARLVDALYDVHKTGTQGGHSLARKWLGLPEHRAYGQADALAAMIATAAPARAQHIALVLILAGIEDNTGVQTWRSPSAVPRAYFTALAAWGYGLSDVEALVTAEPTAPTHGHDDAADSGDDEQPDDEPDDAAYDGDEYDDEDAADDEPTD